ncbi:hypothetical protein WN48_04995 [Eufriesea mexicana]|nr:hypothetical protein WN48_04995 [Eufriesea mexicana]
MGQSFACDATRRDAMRRCAAWTLAVSGGSSSEREKSEGDRRRGGQSEYITVATGGEVKEKEEAKRPRRKTEGRCVCERQPS